MISGTVSSALTADVTPETQSLVVSIKLHTRQCFSYTCLSNPSYRLGALVQCDTIELDFILSATHESS